MRKFTKAAERARWVRKWRRSKLTGQAFCAAHGLSLASLYRWSSSTPPSGPERVVVRPVRLVEAVPAVERATDDRWQWELAGPGGVLRGRALDRVGLGELVAAVARRAG